MRFIKTVYDVFLNVDDIYKIQSEDTESGYNNNFIYIKNGEQYEWYEFPDVFNASDGAVYRFSDDFKDFFACLLVNYILNDRRNLLDIAVLENFMWQDFIEFFEKNKHNFEYLKRD